MIAPGFVGQNLQTWGEVDAYMSKKAKSLGPGVGDEVKNKLSDDNGMKKNE